MEFSPDLTPDQMRALGVLHGVYDDQDPRSNNFFLTRASMKKWKDSWIDPSAPGGWYEWYQKYHSGVRSEDDERQIKRWRSFKARHLAQLERADPSLSNLYIQPKRRQALLNWGIAPGIDVDRALKEGNVNKYLEKVAEKKERQNLSAVHKGAIGYGSTVVSGLAAVPVVHTLKKKMDSEIGQTKVTNADVASYQKAKNVRYAHRAEGEGSFHNHFNTASERAQIKKKVGNSPLFSKVTNPRPRHKARVEASNPAVAMHEYGHAHSFKSGAKKLRGVKFSGYAAGALATKPAGQLALALGATSDNDKVSKGSIAASAALTAPMLVEEARASISPYKHLKKTRGKKVANQFGKTMAKAFGTYATVAGATVGGTVLARSLSQKARREKAKESEAKKYL